MIERRQKFLLVKCPVELVHLLNQSFSVYILKFRLGFDSVTELAMCLLLLDLFLLLDL